MRLHNIQFYAAKYKHELRRRSLLFYTHWLWPVGFTPHGTCVATKLYPASAFAFPI